MINIPETTVVPEELSFEAVMANLAKLLGTTEENLIKMFTNIDERQREEYLYILDIYRTYGYEFCKTYIYDNMLMANSENQSARKGIETIMQRAVIGQQEMNQPLGLISRIKNAVGRI